MFKKIIFLLITFVFTNVVFAKEVTLSQGDFQNAILHYINEYRLQHHRPALKFNQKISAEAAIHSRDMAHKAVPFGHTHFNNRISHLSKKISNFRAGAENVAYYKTDAKRLVAAWIASPEHKQNILGNYNLTGIGIAYSKKGWAYYTQIFLLTS